MTPKPSAPPRQNVAIGIARIARGRADGVDCFAATPQAFLSSLAPLIAFPLVGAALALTQDGPRRALTGLAITLCALLAPAVISFELARLWHRSDSWIRFATAFNWCEWILPVAACVIMVPLGFAMEAGLSEGMASLSLIVLLAAYGLWLHWFLARQALKLPALRAVLFVLLVNLGTAITILLPRFIAGRLA